jgi:hypothetical protein
VLTRVAPYGQTYGAVVALRTINIEDRKLIIDVNSTKRAEKIRRLIEKRLGKEAVYKTTLIEPIESEVERVWAAAAGGPSELPAKEWTKENERTGVISLADLPPEVRLKLEETARQQWVTWFDVPIPGAQQHDSERSGEDGRRPRAAGKPTIRLRTS